MGHISDVQFKAEDEEINDKCPDCLGQGVPVWKSDSHLLHSLNPHYSTCSSCNGSGLYSQWAHENQPF